jgi:hypothetical protein
VFCGSISLATVRITLIISGYAERVISGYAERAPPAVVGERELSPLRPFAQDLFEALLFTRSGLILEVSPA